MDIKIQGQNVRVTDQLTEFTERKLDKLDRYLPNISEIRVDLNRQPIRRGGHQTSAQITLRHIRGAILRVEERVYGDDGDVVRTAITNATDKMYRQIERFKGKRRNKRRDPDIKFQRYFATEEELEVAEEVPEFETADASNNLYTDDHEIVRRKSLVLTPMNEEEAIYQMELLGHAFFMFQNANSGQVNVLYRRDSGGYGILVPNQ
jgi:putative sigma-54 modulation protein